MHYIKTTISLLLVFACYNAVCQVQPLPTDRLDTIKILSWNIYMLPWPVGPAGKIKRAHLISEKIKKSNYDVVVFQEAFNASARNIIASSLRKQYPYQLGPANYVHITPKTHSGLWIVSKVPLRFIDEIAFKNCQGIDCMSKKGAILVQGNFNGLEFQLLATHLESGGPDRIRESQCTEIRKYLLEPYQHSDIPQIICGDFNINKYDTSYYQMIKRLEVASYEMEGPDLFTFDDNENDFKSKSSAHQSLIDFIFLRDKGNRIKNVKRRINILEQPWSRKHKDLSDHYGISANIIFYSLITNP